MKVNLDSPVPEEAAGSSVLHFSINLRLRTLRAALGKLLFCKSRDWGPDFIVKNCPYNWIDFAQSSRNVLFRSWAFGNGLILRQFFEMA